MQVKREESTPTQSIWDNLLDLFLVKVGRIYNVAPKSKCPRSGSLQGHWNDHVQPDAGLAAEEGSEGSERSGDRGIDRQMERIRCHSYQHPWSAPGGSGDSLWVSFKSLLACLGPRERSQSALMRSTFRLLEKFCES